MIVFWIMGYIKYIKINLTSFFILFFVATRNCKITYAVYIIFLLDNQHKDQGSSSIWKGKGKPHHSSPGDDGNHGRASLTHFICQRYTS